MAARKFPPESTEDHRCPKSGDCSVETGLDLKPIEDAKASHMTEGHDWFPASQWPSSGSNSGNSTVRCGSYMQPQTHVPPVNLVTPATSSANTRELFRGSLRQGDYLSAQEQVGCDVALESVLGIPEDGGGTSAALSLEGTGSPKTSTIASSLGVDGVTVGRSQLPQHSSGSPTNRNGTKTSLVCGPLSVQQTLTERQLDIDKRMQEVRQQNRRRLHRRQQEAKEQQLQRIKEQREALLARRERIKLASLWKERGMAAAARPSTVSKGQKKIERLPSDASHPTEDDSRSADDLLAALVISESISLQTELGSTGEAASAGRMLAASELAKIESRSPSHIHCRLRLPNERNVSKGPPTAQPTVSVSSSYQQYKTLPLDIGRNRARQPTDEPKTSSVGMSVSEVGSSKSTEQTNGTLPNTLLSCQFQNSLNSSQRVGYLGRQLQGMPAVPYSSGGSLHPHERAFPLALRRLAKPQMKEAAAEKAKRTFFQRGGHQTCTLLSYEEGEHKKHMQFKSRSAVVVADQQLKKQVDVQLQQHQHHALARKGENFRVSDITEVLLSPSAAYARNSTNSSRTAATNPKAPHEHWAPDTSNFAHLSASTAVKPASTCRPNESASPTTWAGKGTQMQSKGQRALEEKEGDGNFPLFSRMEKQISCMVDNVKNTKPETDSISSAVSKRLEVSANTQAQGLQLVRICRNGWREKGLSEHELVTAGSSDSRKEPCKASQLHGRHSNCTANQMLSLGKKDRYAINFSSLHGECDSSSAAPKPQGDEVDTNGGDTTTNDLKDENRLYALTPKPNVELTENQNPTISAVWALQQAEVEEEKRLLLLEMSQLAIEKQAETKTKERNLQTQLLAQRFEMDLCNGHETFAGGSHPLHKGPQCSDVYSSLMHPVNGSAVPKIEHHIPPNPGAAESCRKIRARFHTLLPIQKEEKLQKTGAPTQRIRTSKQSRWDPAFRAFQASLKTPKPKLYSFPPSKNSVQISRAEQITTDGDDKVHCNGEQQQLQSDFLLKHQHALIGQLLESGISGSQNKAEPPEITAAALSSYACLHACGYRDKHDTSRRVRAIQRRTVLQALQHLLLFPPKTSHRTTLEKGSHLETKGNTPSQESAAA